MLWRQRPVALISFTGNVHVRLQDRILVDGGCAWSQHQSGAAKSALNVRVVFSSMTEGASHRNTRGHLYHGHCYLAEPQVQRDPCDGRHKMMSPMEDNPVQLVGDMIILLYLEDVSLASMMEGIQSSPVAGL